MTPRMNAWLTNQIDRMPNWLAAVVVMVIGGFLLACAVVGVR